MQFRFTFQLAEKSQEAMIRSWIAMDHVKEWLHGQGLKNLLENLEKFFEGKSDCQHWIAYDRDIPFAYILTSPVEEGSAISLDLFICNLNYLGKGISTIMIREFLLSKCAHVEEVFIDPEATNLRAIHVYEKVGFHIVGEFIAKWHPVPHYMMKLSMKHLHKNP